MTASTFTLTAAQSKFPISFIDTDANSAIVTGAVNVASSSDESVLTVTDNGDGTSTVARVGVSGGTATISATVTNASGTSATGTLVVNVDPTSGGGGGGATGDVTDVEIVPGIAS
jgi:hypothetical protein